MQEVKILQDVYMDIEESGFIQYFSYNPFQCHLFLEDQLYIYRQLNKRDRVLCMDATSTILKKIPGQINVYLYSVVMQKPLERRIALPLAEFLTTDQHASEIKHFLDRLSTSLKDVSSSFLPRRVETDLSWPILQAIVAVFNKEDMISNLKWCWYVIGMKKTMKLIEGRTYPHVCSAHMMKTFIRSLSVLHLEK